MNATRVLPLLRALMVAGLLATVGSCHEPTRAPNVTETYFLLSIEGVTAPASELLYLYSDGHFLHEPAGAALSVTGSYSIVGSSITLTFSCGHGAPCLTTWRGTLTVNEPPSPSLLVLREDNGFGRQRTYQLGGEL